MTRVAEFLITGKEAQLVAWIVEKEDLKDDVFKMMAQKSGVPFYAVSGLSELTEVLKKISPCDLGVIGNFGIILNSVNLKVPVDGFVNIHLGLLPEHPGRHPILAVIAGEDEVTGVTLHRATEKVDAGTILDRRVTAMPKNRQMTEVFQKLEVLACQILGDRLMAGAI